MAILNKVKFKGVQVSLNVDISKDEYKSLKGEKDLLVVPVSAFDISLVTGTLGNSNRIMLPNKILKRYDIETLIKNAPSRFVKTKKGKYLVIQLDGPEDLPKFGTGD